MIMVGSNNYLGLTHAPAGRRRPRSRPSRSSAPAAPARACSTAPSTSTRSWSGGWRKFLASEKRARLLHGLPDQPRRALGAAGPRRRRLLGPREPRLDRGRHPPLLRPKRQVPPQRHGAPGALLAEARSRTPASSIVTDGVFSMEGDLCDLPRSSSWQEAYGARDVDDAHGMGVLGAQRPRHRRALRPRGRDRPGDGHVLQELRVAGRRHRRADADVINYIKHKARAVDLLRLHDARRPSPRRSRRWTSSRRSRSAASGSGHRREDARRLPRHGLRHRRFR